MSRSTKSFLIFISFCCIEYSSQDISHYFPQTPEFHYFQQHHPLIPLKQQQQQQHVPVAFQPGLTSFYKPPSAASDSQGLYPQHNFPSENVTPAPVAPVASSSEFLLPEIVENRNAKDRRNFIPLHKQYLAPTPPVKEDETPNYDSPQQGNQQYDPLNGGYIYHKPSTSTTTSTSRPPIVVEDSSEFIPPINNNPIEQVPLATPTHGYNYHVPSSTVAADMTFHQPFSTPAPVYLPPSKDQQLSFVQNFNNTLQLRLQVHEMRCLQQQQPKTNGYLRAVLKIDNFLSATPSVDNDSSDKRCEVKLHKSYLVIDIQGEDFTRCGVQQCDTDLCLRLRFPVVRGIRTGLDNILTLHCKPQSRVAVKSHALKVGVANDVQARSIGTYAKGGTQNSFRTHVELLRKTAQGYTRHLRTNEPVQLGEDLLLRAHVIAGDGWNYTKLTDVSLQRISASGEILNNVQLITTQGCLNPSMKGICTQMPTFDAPLGYKLPFKAIMFQGMRSGEELIMSMRITGCLEYHDCYVNIEQCNNFDTPNLKRRRRDMLNTAPHQNNTEMSEISKISFKVMMPEDNVSTSNDYSRERLVVGTKALILGGSLGFVALLMCLGCFVLNKLRK